MILSNIIHVVLYLFPFCSGTGLLGHWRRLQMWNNADNVWARIKLELHIDIHSWDDFFCYFLFYLFLNVATTSKVSFCFKTSCWLLILKDVDAFCKVLWSCLPWLWKIRVEISSKDVPFQGKSEFLLVCCNVMFRDYGLMIFCV